MQAEAPCQRHSSSSVTASAAHGTWGGGGGGGSTAWDPRCPTEGDGSG